MKNIIVGIHGLANKPQKRNLATAWKTSIEEGLTRNLGLSNPKLNFVMVYWADLLYKNPLHDDKNFDFDKLYNDEPYIKAKPGALIRHDEGWYDSVRASVTDVTGSVLDTVKGFKGTGAVADWVLGKVLKDLAFYYDKNRRIKDRNNKNRLARTVLMEELEKELIKQDSNRIMLISHSMGTIIAYDVLRDMGRINRKKNTNYQVPHVITIGSPLGIAHVKKKVYEERKYSKVRLRTPTIVSDRWVNYADRKDIVALDTHLGDDYGANRKGITVEDDIVLNDYVSPKGDSNHHKSYGYLRTPEISEHIAAFLQGKTK